MTPSIISIPFIPGDGIGAEIMTAACRVIDRAVAKAYQENKRINWKEYLVGKKAIAETGTALPSETLEALKEFKVGIKGPLTTPVGGGFRSLNVQLRQELDLYVCLRQARWFEGLPSPHRNPTGIDITIFRENTEDIYIGIEYQAGTESNRRWMESFSKSHPEDFTRLPAPEECGIGIKPISKFGSQRLVRAAIQWALENHKKRLTLAHKGNIMKYTEGAFRNWGYDIAESEFGDQLFTQRQFNLLTREKDLNAAEEAKAKANRKGSLWMDDVIADVVFEQLITYPQQFDVIATTNLNGDYLSDAAAALSGGVGISPGANINFESGIGVFEANHGSADYIAGKNIANPSSLILSGEMMLRFLGWEKAADLLRTAITETIRSRRVTADLARQIDNAESLGTQEYADVIIENIE
ncbi:MAG TPA: NADP-dependent isocitrate dehydrogenase [Pelolinea sp.]|nr:NADP-dependent isocitrate dehydrogenase [Pelolinea sp.]